jgi:serine/threonine protein phosphatase PrpC
MPRKKSAPVKRSLPSATGGDQPAASRKIFVVEEKGDYVVIAAQGKRRTMEDEHDVIIDELGTGYNYFGVFDGHGGSQCSAFCKSKLLRAIQENISKGNSSLRQAIHDGFVLTDSQYCKICEDDDERVDGSTATVVVHDTAENELHIGQVGDSRAIVVKKTGSCTCLHDIHLPTEEGERKRIAALGGTLKPDSGGVVRVEGVLMVSRSIGDSYLKKFVTGHPSTHTFKLSTTRPELYGAADSVDEEPSDMFLVLGSDGLFDYVQPSEMGNMLSGCKNIDEAKSCCERAVCTALARGSEDNITLMAVPLIPSLKRGRKESSFCED